MGNHIVRCRRNYEKHLKKEGESQRYLECRWNENHVIPEIEFQYHMNQCPDKGSTEKSSKKTLIKNNTKVLINFLNGFLMILQFILVFMNVLIFDCPGFFLFSFLLKFETFHECLFRSLMLSRVYTVFTGIIVVEEF